MKKKKIRLKYKKERVLLCDVLPYELPFTFSNRGFYRYLVRNQIRIDDGLVKWGNHISAGALAVLAFIVNKSVADLQKIGNCLNLEKNKQRIPFTYNILHKPNKFRELTIIHPLNQMQMVDFYEKYKSVLLYFTNLDRFSLRHPNKVACYFFYKDRLHNKLLGKKADKIELFFNEYENLKSYFSYERYNNIYRFYEDYRYQRAEKKFTHLQKFDVQSCFDSIYTHSISWAIGGGKTSFKENFKRRDYSFGGVWDELMREMNYNETNGIVIGPEFSRLFAEVILQHIDKRVDTSLSDKHGFKFNKDYVCYRYVDDYFFFYNDQKVCDQAMILFTNVLKEFKMTISSEKTECIERPFITDISRAKQQIDRLIDDNLTLKMNELDIDETEDDVDKDYVEEDVSISAERVNKAMNTNFSWYFSSNMFNAEFKSILKSCNVKSKDVVNYTLARVATRLNRDLLKFISKHKVLSLAMDGDSGHIDKAEIAKVRNRMEVSLGKFIVNLIDSVFFLYAGSQRVNTTLKMMDILNLIIITFDSNYEDNTVKRFNQEMRDYIFSKIHNEVSLVFQRIRHDENAQIDTLYLLLLIKRLRSKHRLSEFEIKRYMGNTNDESFTFPKLNAIAIEILLYYFGNEQRFFELKNELMNSVIKKYKDVSEKTRKISTELVILTLDLMTCPYIKMEVKKKIGELMGIKKDDVHAMMRYLKKHKTMFMRWEGIDITKELNAKVSQEVYA